jgi:hypothetical protein
MLFGLAACYQLIINIRDNIIHIIAKMKLALSVLALATTASAFAPSAPFSRGLSTTVATTQLFSEPEEEEEEGGLDLDLGEMFDMFDAADKGEDFDKALDGIKSGD